MKNLYKIFDIFIEKDNYFLNELINIGMTKSMVDSYVKSNVIVKTGNVYGLSKAQAKNLFYYGVYLNKNGDYDRGLKCCDLCIKLNSKKANGIIFQKFFVNIKRKNYDEAISYFEDKLSLDKDDYFFLFMLDRIIELPDNYKSIVSNVSESFLLSFNAEYQNELPFESAKIACLNGNYTKAMKLMYKKINSQGAIHSKDALVLTLIKEVKMRKQTLNSIFEFISKKDLDIVRNVIKSYLKWIDKEEYFNLIMAFINLSYLEDDIAFITPMSALVSLKNDSFSVNVDNYLERLYDDLDGGDYQEVEIIKEILNEVELLDCSYNKLKKVR